MKVLGMHHITGISGDAQKNVDFYTDVLGLRMIKKTVNFDDPKTYHLYFSDYTGSPGMVLTFFPWSSEGFKGRRGTGQATTFSYSAPLNAKEYWKKRLAEKSINISAEYSRFKEEVILIEDYDGFEIELIFSEEEKSEGWSFGDVPKEFSLRSFHTTTLSLYNHEATEKLLINTLGYKKIAEENNRRRYQAGEGGPNTYVDIIETPSDLNGRMGVGTIHHIAFRVPNDDEHKLIREKIHNDGYNVTEIIDRNYFHSIYFREPGGVLFEIATNNPGFDVDEDLTELGKKLQLPPWYEKFRNEIENILPKIKVKEVI